MPEAFKVLKYFHAYYSFPPSLHRTLKQILSFSDCKIYTIMCFKVNTGRNSCDWMNYVALLFNFIFNDLHTCNQNLQSLKWTKLYFYTLSFSLNILRVALEWVDFLDIILNKFGGKISRFSLINLVEKFQDLVYSYEV